VTKSEVLRSLYRLIAERGLSDENEDNTLVCPIDSEGAYCGWIDMHAILVECLDSGKSFVITVNT
jgi:hypothetical protein